MSDDPRPPLADLLRRLADDDESRVVAAIADISLVLEHYATDGMRREETAALLPPHLAGLELTTQENEALVRGLAGLLSHTNRVIAASAASSIGYGGQLSVVPDLLSLLEAPVSPPRDLAVGAVRSTARIITDAALARRLSDEDRQLVAEALRVLDQIAASGGGDAAHYASQDSGWIRGALPADWQL